MAPSIFATLACDPGRDFAPIAFLAALDFALVVPNSMPVEDFAGCLRWAASQPPLPMGTFGAGAPGHFGAAIMGVTSRLPVEAVHFRPTGDAMPALLTGTTKGLFGTIALVAPHVQAGRLKALAVTGPERSKVLPDVPTMGEPGRRDLVFTSWFGLVAPAATPPETLAALETAVLRVMDTPDMAARLEQRGFRPAPLGRVRLDALRREETTRWAEVARLTQFRALDGGHRHDPRPRIRGPARSPGGAAHHGGRRPDGPAPCHCHPRPAPPPMSGCTAGCSWAMANATRRRCGSASTWPEGACPRPRAAPKAPPPPPPSPGAAAASSPG